jgi:hypothetical protein
VAVGELLDLLSANLAVADEIGLVTDKQDVCIGQAV